MHHLIEREFDGEKVGATTRVHIVDEGDSSEEIQRIQEDCRSRDRSGRHCVRIDTSAPGRRSSSTQSAASSEDPKCLQVRMTSEAHGFTVRTNAPMVAQAVTRVENGTTLQHALEPGVGDQWKSDVIWTRDTITATAPCQPTFWDDLTGEPLDTQAVRAARDLEIKYFKKMEVDEKVPMAEAREKGQARLGVRWVAVRKAGVSH